MANFFWILETSDSDWLTQIKAANQKFFNIQNNLAKNAKIWWLFDDFFLKNTSTLVKNQWFGNKRSPMMHLIPLVILKSLAATLLERSRYLSGADIFDGRRWPGHNFYRLFTIQTYLKLKKKKSWNWQLKIKFKNIQRARKLKKNPDQKNSWNEINQISWIFFWIFYFQKIGVTSYARNSQKKQYLIFGEMRNIS